VSSTRRKQWVALRSPSFGPAAQNRSLRIGKKLNFIYQIPQWSHTNLSGIDTSLNLFAPPSALANRYAGASVAMDATKNGQLSRGSGFLVRFDESVRIFTCKHNVVPAGGVTDIQISDSKGSKLTFDTPKLFSRYDLAMYRLTDLEQHPIRLNRGFSLIG
jgi:hypothetical protein